jgi:hypothetical protein
MKTDDDPQLARIELFLNELGADIQVQQIVLQNFLMNMFLTRPDGAELWLHLRSQCLDTLEKAANASDDPQDGERLKRLTVARAERFLRPLDLMLGIQTVPPGTRSN